MSSVPSWLARAWDAMRPLDPVRSVKMKFALVVGTSAVLTASFSLVALLVLQWRVRYSLVVAVLLALAFSQVLAHGMTSPLRQMTAAARELARGRPAPPVRTGSRDEVGELARAFTAMSRELAAADEQRRRLLADVGHELRTPVAALRAQVENLADGVRPADDQALAEVLAQVERLGALLTDLLDLAKADAGATPLERGDVPIAAFVEDLAHQVRTARPGRLIDVVVQPADLAADADPGRLAQVVTNLLDNAVRHAVSVVTVHAWSEHDVFVLEVTDDGPGIPRERWDTVFERFRGGTGPLPVITGRGVTGGTGGGTGLGLAIARWAVVLHGGRIAVVPADVGCRIRVEIPGRERVFT